MIEVLNWIFQDPIHFFGVLLLMAFFFRGLARVVGSARGGAQVGADRQIETE